MFRVPLERQGKRCAMCGHVYEASCTCLKSTTGNATMNRDWKIEATKELAENIKASGFRVFIAERGTYGFYTDAEGSKVVSFQLDLGGFNFTGNYKTDQPRRFGTGWQLNQAAGRTYQDMFNEHPSWALHGASWEYTTLEQYLKTYQASSVYTEV